MGCRWIAHDLYVQPLLAGNAVQDDAHVPVAQAISQEQEVALAQLRRERHRDEIRQVRAREVVDVVIFGDDVAVALAVGDRAIDRAVDLQDDGPLFERQIAVLVRDVDEPVVPPSASVWRNLPRVSPSEM